MSRSRPHENSLPNPARRWFEWDGAKGCIRYYDKEQQKYIDVADKFTFVLLEQMGSVGGWHDASDSSIYSNEVKDTTQDVLIVRAFKGGTLAEGFYRDIRDRVTSKAIGGQFVANCYIAYRDPEINELVIASLRLKGAALGQWMDFSKKHRVELYTKGVRITGFTDGQKGAIRFRKPTFKIVDLTKDVHEVSVALDDVLQTYLDNYLKKNKREQVAAAPSAVSEQPGVTYDVDPYVELPPDVDDIPPPIDDDDIPF